MQVHGCGLSRITEYETRPNPGQLTPLFATSWLRRLHAMRRNRCRVDLQPKPAVHAPSCTLSGACGGDTVTLCWPCVTCRAVHGRRRALKVLVYRQRTGRGGWLCSAANNNCHYTRSHVRLCTTRCSKAPPARPQIIKQVNRHIRGYIESAEQSRTAEHFWLAAYSASKSDNKPV